MTTPLFSIVLPTYDRAELLAEAIDSVLAQSIDDFEVVVVDDASPEPVEVPPDARIRVERRTKNGGPSAAFNTGMRVARGRYFAFLADDDLYTRDRLALAVEGLRHAPVALCWSCYLGEDVSSGRLLNGNVYDSIMDFTIPSLGVTAIQRELAPTFDERFVAVQDVDWWLKVAAATQVATISSIGYLVRKHSGVRHGNDTEARIAGSLRLLQTHEQYFRTHPRAAGFRWKRIGWMAGRVGDYELARRAFLNSLRLRPEARTVWHLARSLRASRNRVHSDDLHGALLR
jgi:glycosyltransferase involved in cell wall biosynthesis